MRNFIQAIAFAAVASLSEAVTPVFPQAINSDNLSDAQDNSGAVIKIQLGTYNDSDSWNQYATALNDASNKSDNMANAQIFTENVMYAQAQFNDSSYDYYLFCLGDDGTYGGMCVIYYTSYNQAGVASVDFQYLRYSGANWKTLNYDVTTALNTEAALAPVILNMINGSPPNDE